MKIGIDISQIAYPGTGVANYTTLLVQNLLKVDKTDDFILFGSSLRNKKKLKDFVKEIEAKNKEEVFSFLPIKFLEFLWNGIHVFPIENFIGEIDVFHSSDWLEPPTKKAKRITTIHDFAVYKYPETFSPRGGHNIVLNQKRKLFFVKNYSDKIIAVSQTTKNDAIDILKIPEKKIEVIYEAPYPFFDKRPKDEVEKTKIKFNIKDKYILCVGTREPRKNLDRVVMAFAQIADKFPNLNLVIAGKYGWGDDMTESRIKNLESRVKLLGFVENEDLAKLYSGAEALCYPSLYEGFGLPILDAMSCGCPVITSNIGSMKELASGFGLLVDPQKIESIANAMSKILINDEVRKELSIAGLSRSKEFSWEKTALQTLNLYKSFF